MLSLPVGTWSHIWESRLCFLTRYLAPELVSCKRNKTQSDLSQKQNKSRLVPMIEKSRGFSSCWIQVLTISWDLPCLYPVLYCQYWL